MIFDIRKKIGYLPNHFDIPFQNFLLYSRRKPNHGGSGLGNHQGASTPLWRILTMKKLMKNILNIRQHQQAEVQPDTAKARCYACINGIIIPVL